MTYGGVAAVGHIQVTAGDTDRFGDPTKTFDDFDRFTFGFGGPDVEPMVPVVNRPIMEHVLRLLRRLGPGRVRRR